MSDKIERATLTLGLDFSPLKVDIGDGHIWLFHADPSPEQFNALVTSLAGFGSMVGADESPEAAMKAVEEIGPLLDSLQAAILQLLTTDKQRKEFTTKGYGVKALQGTAALLMDPSGFPTE